MYLSEFSLNEFEILGSSDRGGDNFEEIAKIRLKINKEDSAKIKGKKVYKRLFIRRLKYSNYVNNKKEQNE